MKPPHANHLAFLLNLTASRDCYCLFNTSPPVSQNFEEPRNTLINRCSILAHGKPPCLQVMVQICCTIYLSFSSSSPPLSPSPSFWFSLNLSYEHDCMAQWLNGKKAWWYDGSMVWWINCTMLRCKSQVCRVKRWLWVQRHCRGEEQERRWV